jgi:hypothetical protein
MFITAIDENRFLSNMIWFVALVVIQRPTLLNTMIFGVA